MRKVSHVLQHLLRASNVMYQPRSTVATDYTTCVVGLLMSICTFQRSRICGPTRYKQPNRKNTQSKLLYQAQCKLICTHQCSQLHVQCVHDRFSLPYGTVYFSVKWGVLCDEVGDHVWPCIRLAPVTHCSTLNCVALVYEEGLSCATTPT